MLVCESCTTVIQNVLFRTSCMPLSLVSDSWTFQYLSIWIRYILCSKGLEIVWELYKRVAPTPRAISCMASLCDLYRLCWRQYGRVYLPLLEIVCVCGCISNSGGETQNQNPKLRVIEIPFFGSVTMQCGTSYMKLLRMCTVLYNSLLPSEECSLEISHQATYGALANHQWTPLPRNRLESTGNTLLYFMV